MTRFDNVPQEPEIQEGLCYKCRIQKGYRLKDQGAHTALRKKCECCKAVSPILGSRHWVKAK